MVQYISHYTGETPSTHMTSAFFTYTEVLVISFAKKSSTCNITYWNMQDIFIVNN